MKICGMILAILYAGLMLFAVCKEKSKGLSSLVIAAGGVVILAYAMLNIAWGKDVIWILIAGMIGISAGTLINGIQKKNVHIHHHVIRLVVEAVITAICWIGG